MKKLKYKKFVLTISYGDFTVGVGGTDKAIMSQHKVYEALHISTVHIFHRTQVWKIRNIPGFVWGLCVDGETLGFFSTDEICSFLYRITNKGNELKGCVIHHLRDICLGELNRILNLTSVKIWFYLHDYMSVCPGGLIKNNKEYCGVSFPDIDKCNNCCIFRSDFIEKTDEIRIFFKTYENRISFVAPSHAAKDEWCKAYPQFIEKVIVVYHQDKTMGEVIHNDSETITTKQPLKIAFVGVSKQLKGWNEWKKAAEALHTSKNYSLFHFGRCHEHLNYIKEISVDFRKSENAMTDALKENDIDCVVLWSILPETYSYTYYESWAADTFIITSPLSGNIASQVQLNDNGYIAGHDESLVDVLSNDLKLYDMIGRYKRKKRSIPLRYREAEDIEKIISQQSTAEVNKTSGLLSYRTIISKIYNIPYKIVLRRQKN